MVNPEDEVLKGAKTVWEQLRERYPAPEWALFFEVANGTGATTRRYADAVGASLFPSRGLDFHGFEVKTSRADWLRELKDPGKADVIASYCDFWWLVAGDEKVAAKDEIPRTWGFLVSKNGELRQVKRAERLDAKPLDRKFAMAMFRRADQWTKQQLKDDRRIVRAKEEGFKAGKEERDWENTSAKADLAHLQERLAEFEKTSGVGIASWRYGDVGEAVKAFLFSRKHDITEDLERTAGWIEDTAKGLRERVALLRKSRSLVQDPPKADLQPSPSAPAETPAASP